MNRRWFRAGFAPPFGFWFRSNFRFPRRQEYLRMLKEYQQELEEELADVKEEITEVERGGRGREETAE